MYRFKILIFFLTVAVVSSVCGGAWWVWTRYYQRDEVIGQEIKKEKSNKKDAPDPGMRRFDAAVETIQIGSEAEGREQLYDLVKHFPDSKRAPDAKRIIGEMNMDALFSANQNPDRKDHVVQRGESLTLIARKNATTIEALMRANGMMSTGLQPGDHLFLFPLDFELLVRVGKKTVTLLKDKRFFKEYNAVDIKLSTGMKARPLGEEPELQMEIIEKTAWYGGKRVQALDSHFMSADKWIMVKGGFAIRALPQGRIASDNIVLVEPKGAGGGKKVDNKKGAGAKTPAHPAPKAPAPKGKHGQPKGAILAGTSVDDDDTDATPAPAETGVFLTHEDVEELFTIIRTKSKMRIVR